MPANRKAPPAPAPDAVALYRLIYSSEEAAIEPVAMSDPAQPAPSKPEPARHYGPGEGDLLMTEVEAIAAAHRVSVADIDRKSVV